MSQFISNSAARRNAMLRFTALFLVATALACLVFLRLFYVQKEVQVVKLHQFEELAPVLDKLVAYGESLQDYEEAITSNPVEAPRLQSQANEKSVEIHSMLYGKEKNPHYPQFNSVLQTGDQFFNYLKSSGDKFLTIQKEVDTCKEDKKDLEKELKDMEKELKECEDKVAKCKKW